MVYDASQENLVFSEMEKINTDYKSIQTTNLKNLD